VIVATALLKLHLPQAHSLKDKRRVVKSILARLHNEYAVSASEVEDQDLWQVATLGIAYVSNDASHANSVVSKAVAFVETGHWETWLSGYELEILHVF
jgi:uncharacterized protein YlxP (DUF503 family)